MFNRKPQQTAPAPVRRPFTAYTVTPEDLIDTIKNADNPLITTYVAEMDAVLVFDGPNVCGLSDSKREQVEKFFLMAHNVNNPVTRYTED